MHDEIKKSDWKRFKKVQQDALQRICKRILDEARGLADDQSKTYHERYLAVFQLIREGDKDIATGFDDLSRSRMLNQLAFMVSQDLVDSETIEQFSDDVQQKLKRYEDIYGS